MKFCSNCASEVQQKIPDGDNVSRWVCSDCGMIHYQNPKIVVGCVTESAGKILLCKRAIEPRYGYWTVPAGFMEIGETIAEGAARETLEEACAKVEIGRLFASVDVIDAAQLHLFFTATLVGDYAAGHESLDARLFARDEIPWQDIAFRSGLFALEKYLEDDGRDNGVHLHEVRRGKE
ncbi:MAG: NUDIX hydrolase [Woeseiaceae bacterium]|nr:NUDIX hydrolase [Woeseiaceae bacterium]